ncbi:MAG: proton-conducting transporter membrane subunit [Candidatus Bipolaricaulota bacterium]
MHVPILAIGVPLLGAFALPLMAKVHRRLRDLWAVLVGSFTVAMIVTLAVQVFTVGVQVYTLGAAEPDATLGPAGFPIRITLVADAMGVFMALISALIAGAALVYALGYLKEGKGKTLSMSLFLLLWAGMLGLKLTGDMFNFFVFLEITTVAACGLIGYRVWESRPPEAAFKTLVMFILGGLMVLLAVAVLYGEYGALNIAFLSAQIEGSLIDRVALGLLVGGLLMKAGAVPMHMWAPDAYGEADANTAIVLVANTQAGLYGLFRMVFTLYGGTPSPEVGWLVTALGALTVLVAVLMAVVQMDLGRLVAYGAVSQIGYMLLASGVGLVTLATRPEFGRVALQGGVFHMFNDAACIGLLLLCVGAVRRTAGTGDLRSLGGLAHTERWTSGFFLLGALALAGIPPLNGFASKLMIYQSVFRLSPILAALAVLASILLLAVFVRAFQGAFLGPRQLTPAKPLSPAMLVSMGVLAAVVIAFGLVPDLVVRHMVAPAADALWMGRKEYLEAVGIAIGGMR